MDGVQPTELRQHELGIEGLADQARDAAGDQRTGHEAEDQFVTCDHFHDDDESRQRRLGYGGQEPCHSQCNERGRIGIGHRAATSLPTAAPMASEGAKMPAGTPDQAVSQVLIIMKST